LRGAGSTEEASPSIFGRGGEAGKKQKASLPGLLPGREGWGAGGLAFASEAGSSAKQMSFLIASLRAIRKVGGGDCW